MIELSRAFDDHGFDGSISLLELESQRNCEVKYMLISGYGLSTFTTKVKNIELHN